MINFCLVSFGSKTLVQPGENTIVGLSVASRVQETAKDKENITNVSDGTDKLTKGGSKKSRRDSETLETTNAQSDVNTDERSNVPSQPQSKKRKLQTEKPKKAVRRKLIPQIKGQQSLTKFFRL